VPSVQHLHGEAVALSDPSDQDVVRSRLCPTQWPSRKVCRIGLTGGSMGKARFCKLSQLPESVCDLPHRRGFSGSHRACGNKQTEIIGIIIQKNFLRAQACAADLTKAWSTKQYLRDGCLRRRPTGSGLPRHNLRIRANLRCQTRVITACAGPGFGSEKIPNLKASHLDFLAEFHLRRDHGHRCVLVPESNCG
jgi:hypothetical protein